MSRTLHVHPSVESHLADRCKLHHGSGVSATGLLLGQSWDLSRVFVLTAVPTPTLPPGDGWTAGEWFTEHARQVKRMLVGGVEIVGAYLAAGASQPMSDAQVRDIIFSLPITAPALDRYLVRASPKLTCEVFTGAKKDAVKPKPVSTIKVAAFTEQLVTFTTTIQLDLTIPVVAASTSSSGSSSSSELTLKSQLKRALESYHTRLLAAPASIDGSTAIDLTATVEKAFDSSSGGKSGKGKQKGKTDAAVSSENSVHEVEFFLRPSAAAASTENSTGVIVLQGACQCRVYAHNKYTVGQALAALRYDVLQSLLARLQLLSEDAEETSGGAPFSLPSSPSHTWSLPRRVFALLPCGGAVSDYLLPAENEADGKERIQELLGVTTVEGGMNLGEKCAEVEEKKQEKGGKQGKDGKAAAASGSSSSTSTSNSTQPATATATKADSSSQLPMILVVAAIGVGLAIAATQLL
jgi:hypothetical protein